jgi:hypothetical protein
LSGGRATLVVWAVLGAGVLGWVMADLGVLSPEAAARAAGGTALAVVLSALVPPLWRSATRASELEAELRRRGETPPRPGTLREDEMAVRFACARGGRWDVHFRLRPLLREVAAHRLRFHRGTEMGGGGGPAQGVPGRAARDLLGEQLWELVREDRPEPPRKAGSGIPGRDLERIVRRLEDI